MNRIVTLFICFSFIFYYKISFSQTHVNYNPVKFLGNDNINTTSSSVANNLNNDDDQDADENAIDREFNDNSTVKTIKFPQQKVNFNYNPVKYLDGEVKTDFEVNKSVEQQNKSFILPEADLKNPTKYLPSEKSEFKELNTEDVKVFASGTEAVAGKNSVNFCINLGHPADNDYMIPLDFSGSTAINGVDFMKIPDYVVIKKGEQTYCLTINPFSNQIASASLLKIKARISKDKYDDFEIKLRNCSDMVASIGKDISIMKGDNVTLTATQTGGVAPYIYRWNNNSCNSSSLKINPLETTTYTVTITDKCGSVSTASVKVKVKPEQNYSEENEN